MYFNMLGSINTVNYMATSIKTNDAVIYGLIIGIVLNVILSAITASKASLQGRSPVAWFFLALILGGAIGLIIICCVDSHNTDIYSNSKVSGSSWTCSKCGKTNVKGDYCYHCGNKKVENKATTKSSYNGIWACNVCGKINQGGDVCENCGAERGKRV